MPSLAALGDLVLEVAVSAAQQVQEGTDVPGTVRIRRGGSAANVAVAFANLGGRASFIGSLGRDGVAARLSRALRDSGVAVHAPRVDAATARLLALVGVDGERSFVTERGAADQLLPGDLKAAWFRKLGVLHVPGYSLYSQPISEAASAAVGRARAAGALISIDLSSRGPMLAYGRARTWDVLDRLAPDVLFGNLSEAVALTDGGALAELLRVARVAVVKEGPVGCRVLWRDPDQDGRSEHELWVATEPVTAPDTTGAGDAFAAGFLHTLLGPAGVPRPRQPRPWNVSLLRRAALAGHRSAAAHLRETHTELAL